MRNSKWLYLLTIIFTLGFITACEENTTNQDARWYPPAEKTGKNTNNKPKNIYGHWVCDDFINLVKARKTVRGIRHRPFFLEIVFNPDFGDSALLVTGYTDFKAAYTKAGQDSIVLKNIVLGKDLILFVDEGMTRLQLEDVLVGEKADVQAHTWMFSKQQSAQKKGIINSLTNKELMAGNYTLKEKTVRFLENGSVSGLQNYTTYNVCNGGDCFGNTRTDLDIIELQGNGKNERMAFLSKTNDSVYLYMLKPLVVKNKTYYVPDSVAYGLKKIR